MGPMLVLLGVAFQVSSLRVPVGTCLTCPKVATATFVACIEPEQASQTLLAMTTCADLVATAAGHVPFGQQGLLVCAGFVAAQLGRGADAKTAAGAADQTSRVLVHMPACGECKLHIAVRDCDQGSVVSEIKQVLPNVQTRDGMRCTMAFVESAVCAVRYTVMELMKKLIKMASETANQVWRHFFPRTKTEEFRQLLSGIWTQATEVRFWFVPRTKRQKIDQVVSSIQKPISTVWKKISPPSEEERRKMEKKEKDKVRTTATRHTSLPAASHDPAARLAEAEAQGREGVEEAQEVQEGQEGQGQEREDPHHGDFHQGAEHQGQDEGGH